MEIGTSLAPTTHGLAVRVANLSVDYRVIADRKPTLRKAVAAGVRSREIEIVHAVRDVSFEVERGEVMGIIGSNGSGKSTLVRTIAGLHVPVSGYVHVSARPTLLGIGAVLKPKLSGARNVMLGCLALGMTRQQAEDKFDQIVEFAGLHQAIDRPLRTYSSGMRARLHFAIATSIDSELLLVDEVLAVGDRDFKKRSMQRINQLRERAGAVLMVSHSLRQVAGATTRTLWLEEGQLRGLGDSREVIKAYRKWSKERRRGRR